MLLQWFAATFLIAVISMVMKFYFTNYNPVRIGIQNGFKLQKRSLRNVLDMNQTIYAKKDKGYYFNLCENSSASYGDLHEELHLNMCANLIYIIGMLAFITYINWAFGLFFAGYGVVLVIISLNSAKPLYRMNRDILAVQDIYLMDMRNIIENKGNINALHAEDFFHNKFKDSTASYEKHIVLVMGYQYMGYFAMPIATVCSIAMRYRSNKVHIERVDELEEDAGAEKENTAYKNEDEKLLVAENFDFYKGEEKEDFLYHINKLELKKNGLYIIKGENGSFADNLYGIQENKELRELLRVDFAEKGITVNPVNLSYGQQQKLALMRVLGTDAPILFLDEPLSNLDVETQQEVVRYIAGLKGKKSVLVVMHSDELDEIADGVVMIRDYKAELA